jgi:hypothetical protein
LSMAVTILFGGSVGDALATLGIGLAIQPALERIERSQLPSFSRSPSAPRRPPCWSCS